ncbi:hypothetical protein [Arthrobacter antibioticus]|uniref:hypothetical protein n=1 Tax=Arthrobacter sp. H35-MC1 TaxID=3046203 RepID=UPI0024BAB693|nr:hypothetical protein [Arthrobacter sp. H35-MC1]MDJ0316336.1 hypothetical protein [Arthrobacter sp. H35-MC1]
MKEIRNLPRWAMIFSFCIALLAAAFVIIGVIDVLNGAGADKVIFNALAAAAFGLGAWSIAVKGNPALSRRHEGAPNRQSPTRW